MRCILCAALVQTVFSAVPLVAQQSLARRPEARFASAHDPRSRLAPAPELVVVQQPAPVPALGMAGILGASIGFFGGLFLGSNVENEFLPCGCDDPGLAGALVGAVVGPGLTTPLAVHLANGGRGSLATGYGWAALVSGAGMLGMLAGIRSEVGLWFLLATPVAQVVAAVASERATTGDAPGR